jgi:hypothetical protein
MSILDRIKLKAGEVFARNLAADMEAGKFGPRVQSAYVKTKGQKSLIGFVLTLITASMTEFAPPYATEFFRYSAVLAAGLTALGVLDKLRRKEPIFPLWFLEALAKVTMWLTGFEAAFGYLVTHGWFEGLVATHGQAMDLFTLYMSAAVAATAFVNRAAKASAAVPTITTKEAKQ